MAGKDGRLSPSDDAISGIADASTHPLPLSKTPIFYRLAIKPSGQRNMKPPGPEKRIFVFLFVIYVFVFICMYLCLLFVYLCHYLSACLK